MNKRLITTGDIELIHRLARKVFMTIFVQGGSEQKHLNYVLDRFGQLIYAQGIESCREDIRAMASVVDKKVLGLFREGVMCGDKLLAVAESVPDEELLDIFAMQLWHELLSEAKMREYSEFLSHVGER
ncbi:hypothetical protein [uncultured Ruminococcus sp.]|uniref:hypothetical protein n=1 Tax=uncultured Ruminococcus sp. TaxID=165186 RepID=UPI002666E607|nr:hypothetical protein [uncultured Ruminococcus sp.]